jgi:hypothetical protein
VTATNIVARARSGTFVPAVGAGNADSVAVLRFQIEQKIKLIPRGFEPRIATVFS